MAFDDLTIPGDYIDYDILERGKETIIRNDEVWVKTKKLKMERESNVNYVQ